MTGHRYKITYSPAWNLFLLTVGGFLYALSVKSIAVPQGFITGGLFGSAMLVYYATDLLTPGAIYLLLNIPLFAIGLIKVSWRFFWYSLYCMILTTVAYEVIPWTLGIQNQLYAAVAAGVLGGAGAGIVLRSLGSFGGLDVVAIMLNQRYNLGLGKFYMIFNMALFFVSFFRMSVDLIIASSIMVFITSMVMEHMLALFSQRKVVLIISDHSQEICCQIHNQLRQGVTYIQGRGAYSGNEKNILMTVINNVQLKKLEEIVFTTDENSLFIVENTFNVLGASFSRRKLY